jgi:uncharacterized C2H2 Zn-finger protein
MDRELKTAQRPPAHPDDELAPAPGDLRCAHCEGEFDSTEDLDAHLRQAHGLSGVRVVRCPECQAEFGTENAAAIHRREAHGALV